MIGWSKRGEVGYEGLWEGRGGGASLGLRKRFGERMGDVPGVCDDDVVEWGVFFAETGEAYP